MSFSEKVPPAATYETSTIIRGRKKSIVKIDARADVKHLLIVTIREGRNVCLQGGKIPRIFARFRTPNSTVDFEQGVPKEVRSSEIVYATSLLATTEPKWNECFDVPWMQEYGNDNLEIQILHKPRFSTKVLLGTCYVPLLEAKPDQEIAEAWYTVVPYAGRVQPTSRGGRRRSIALPIPEAAFGGGTPSTMGSMSNSRRNSMGDSPSHRSVITPSPSCAILSTGKLATPCLLVRIQLITVDEKHYESVKRTQDTSGSPKGKQFELVTPGGEQRIPLVQPTANGRRSFYPLGRVCETDDLSDDDRASWSDSHELGPGDTSDIAQPKFDVGTLEVTIVSGYELLPRGAIGGQDVEKNLAYICRIFWRGRRFVTVRPAPGRSPEWSEHFSLPLKMDEINGEFLVISVQTHKGALAGSVCICIDQLHLTRLTQDWYLLQKGRCGQIFIQAHFHIKDADVLKKLMQKRNNLRSSPSIAITGQPVETKLREQNYIGRLREAKATALKLEILAARDLQTRKDNIKQMASRFPSAFVEFEWLGKKMRTSVRPHNLNPKWTDQFILTIPQDSSNATKLILTKLDERPIIALSVYDDLEQEDEGKGLHKLGTATLNLIGLDGSKQIFDYWTHLDTRGALKVRCCLATSTGKAASEVSSQELSPQSPFLEDSISPVTTQTPPSQIVLSVNIVGGHNLRHKRCFSIMHFVYCRINWKGYNYTTSMSKSFRNPKWQECFDMTWPEKEETNAQLGKENTDPKKAHNNIVFTAKKKEYLTIKVYCDNELHQSHFLGSCFINTDDLKNAGPNSGSIFLPVMEVHAANAIPAGTDFFPIYDAREVVKRPVICVRFSLVKPTVSDASDCRDLRSRRGSNSTRASLSILMKT